ncbi:MAG: hypothetical protein P8106_03820 [Gammaproteobacteria bacterium]
MFGKILLTVAVIVGAVLILRLRARRAAPAQAVAAPVGQGRVIRGLAVGAVIVMLAAAVLMLYLEWRAGSEVIQVRVIDARSGQAQTYQVLRGDVDERSFLTTDGRRIVLAETERMELPGR